MAKNTPKAVDKNVLGGVKQATSSKGPFGGGTKYNQMKQPSGFELVKPITGHTQKSNIKKP